MLKSYDLAPIGITISLLMLQGPENPRIATHYNVVGICISAGMVNFIAPKAVSLLRKVRFIVKLLS